MDGECGPGPASVRRAGPQHLRSATGVREARGEQELQCRASPTPAPVPACGSPGVSAPGRRPAWAGAKGPCECPPPAAPGSLRLHLSVGEGGRLIWPGDNSALLRDAVPT